MKIKAGDLVVQTPCRGCMCHEMAMIFGRDRRRCAECGCPATVAAVRAYAAEKPETVVSP